MTISLPMYGINRHKVDHLWGRLREQLRRRGLENLPEVLCWPDPLLPHWRDPRLLLSQTCGYPLVTALPDVQVVGRFHYDAPGCDGGNYRSLLIVRASDPRATLADFRQGITACNSPDSHSGYNVLRFMVAPLSGHGRFFKQVLFTGAHVQSLDAVRGGLADITAVDCVTFALLRRARPLAVKGLRVLAESPAAPGLPLITAAATPPDAVALLRDALAGLVAAPDGRRECAAVLIKGFSAAAREDYRAILHMRREAERLDVTAL